MEHIIKNTHMKNTIIVKIKFIEVIHTYSPAINISHKNSYTIKDFTTKYNATFKPVDNLCRIKGKIQFLNY